MDKIDTSTAAIEWPRNIWAGERMADEFSGYHVFSVHATIARFDGDIDREREFHRYVDADIFDSEQRYHEHQRTALAAERDAAVLRAEQAYEQLKKLLASQHYSYIGKDGKQVLARELEDERDALRAENERWRSNSIDTWESMQAMRNAINEHCPMPSIESDLLQGPENSIFCATVAEAVIGTFERKDAEIERLRELLAQVPSAINSAFSAGIEEREGGSASRQAKLMEPVDKLRDDIRSALAAWRAKQ